MMYMILRYYMVSIEMCPYSISVSVLPESNHFNVDNIRVSKILVSILNLRLQIFYYNKGMNECSDCLLRSDCHIIVFI